MPARLRVLAKGKFRRFQGNYPNNSGVEFQVTECEHDGRRFFVRENFRYDTFTSNSGVRWGLQQGHTVSGVNVLELACQPEHFEGEFPVANYGSLQLVRFMNNAGEFLRTAPLSGGFRQERVPSPCNR